MDSVLWDLSSHRQQNRHSLPRKPWRHPTSLLLPCLCSFHGQGPFILSKRHPPTLEQTQSLACWVAVRDSLPFVGFLQPLLNLPPPPPGVGWGGAEPLPATGLVPAHSQPKVRVGPVPSVTQKS